MKKNRTAASIPEVTSEMVMFDTERDQIKLKTKKHGVCPYNLEIGVEHSLC